MKQGVRGWMRANRRAVVFAALFFVAGFITRHEINWLWDHVLMYVIMPVVGLVAVVGYMLFMGSMADKIAETDMNSPEQVKLREMLLNQDQPRQNY
jgi:uncharacterized membrane protein